MHFFNPWMLLLCWFVPVLGLLLAVIRHLKNRALEKMLAPTMLRKLCPVPGQQRFYRQLTLAMLGLLLLCLAAARPQWGEREETARQRGRDLVIALDVSRSMLAQDVRPNRLQRAKTDILDLIRALRGDRAALIAFRGKAVQLCPLTTDYAYLQQTLDEISIDSAPRGGTDIGDAIQKAMDAMESDLAAHQAIILISDGEDLSGKAIAAAEAAKQRGIAIFTVGLGDPQGAKIPSSTRPNEFMMHENSAVISKLEHDTLRKIAELTGGAYVPVGTANVKLGKLYRDHLSRLAARDIEESLQRRYIDRYQWFLLPGWLAFMAMACLSRGRPLRSNKPNSSGAGALRIAGSALILLLTASIAQTQTATQNAVQSAGTNNISAPPRTNLPQTNLPSSNQTPSALTGRRGARQAQKLYRSGAYKEAAQAYLQAMQGQTKTLQDQCIYNAGCALFQAGDYKTAAAKFNELTARQKDGQLPAFYNLGCALFREASLAQTAGTNLPPQTYPKFLERAGQAFQSAARLGPDEEAKFNLALTTNLLTQARAQAKTRALLERYGTTPPPDLADMLLKNQRQLIAKLPEAMTNSTPAHIGKMEELSAQQAANTDLLIPLQAALQTANIQTPDGAKPPPGQIEQQMAQLRETMQTSAELLRNLDQSAYHAAFKSELGIYQTWKGMADFTRLLAEDLYRQSNTIALTDTVLERAAEVELPAITFQQGEGKDLTRLFAERFAQSVPPEGMAAPPTHPGQAHGQPVTNALPAAPETNAPAQQIITAETRSNILALAQETQIVQDRALSAITATNLTESVVDQRLAYELLKEIEKLLPKNQNQDQSQDQQNQNQQNEQNQEQQKEQQSPENEKNDQQPEQQPEQKPEEQQPEQKPEQQQEQESAQNDSRENEQEITEQEARAILEKALQREKDRRDERRRKEQEYIPPSPMDRDW